MSRSIRILLATDAVGGMWVYSVELARALRPLGIDAVLAIVGPAPGEDQRRRAEGLQLIETDLPLDWMPTSPREMRRAGFEIARIAEAEGADLIQTGSAAMLADSAIGRPCVAVQHSCVATWWAAVRGTPLPREFAWRRDLIQDGLNSASAVIAPTAAFAAQTARAYEVCRPVLCVHNGRRSAQPVGIRQGDFVFTASRLWDDGKNVATLDAAAARLKIPFEAAGPLAGPNGASAGFDNLQLIGEIGESRLAGLLAARPIFASSALYEPFGLSVLEAAQAGCALVLSDIPSFRELWRDVAVFVPATDDEAFAETIDLLMRDREARNALGKAAQARAQHYTPEAMAARMADIYASLTAPSETSRLPLQMIGTA